MKTIAQVLSECPKHDCAYVLYNGRWHRIVLVSVGYDGDVWLNTLDALIAHIMGE